MQWVKRNIYAFGGNGEDITIFGQSAGGVSIWMHLVQTASFGLYSKAIMESGTGATVTSFERAEDEYSTLLNVTQCKDLGCLLAVDPDNLIRNASAAGLSVGGSWAPVVDNVSLPMPPADLVDHRLFNNKVPIMMGSTRDENAAFTEQDTIKFPANMTESQFDMWFEAAKSEASPQLSVPKGASLSKVKELYDPNVYTYPSDLGPCGRWWWTATRVLTDKVPSLGACSVRWLARLYSKGGSPAVFAYLFAHPPLSGDRFTAAHSSEIEFVFDDRGTILFDPIANPSKRFATAAEADLAKNVSAYWQTFAQTGKPEPADLPAWPAFTREGDKVLRLDAAPDGIHPQQGLRKQACDYWESLYWESSALSIGEQRTLV